MPTHPRGSSRVTIASGLNILVGIWLIASLWVLGFARLRPVLWNDIVVGVLVVLLAGIRVSGPRGTNWTSWVNVVLGAWVVASPWIFYASGVTAVFWDEIVVGAVILLLAVGSATAPTRNAPGL